MSFRYLAAAFACSLLVACGSGGSGDTVSTSGSGGSTSGSGGSSPWTGGGTDPNCVNDNTSHKGDGTYYDATGDGNCMFGPSPSDLMVGAMNHADYAGSATCGACASVVGPSGTIKIRIVDQCPGCMPGDIDLSPVAFDGIAARALGRVAISWQYIPCGVMGPVSYRFKEGSNPWWTAVQVRHHRYAVATFAYRKADGSYEQVARADYNYFVADGGMGPGPYTFRVTDVFGHTIEDSNISLQEGTEVAGSHQFPECVGK